MDELEKIISQVAKKNNISEQILLSDIQSAINDAYNTAYNSQDEDIRSIWEELFNGACPTAKVFIEKISLFLSNNENSLQ